MIKHKVQQLVSWFGSRNGFIAIMVVFGLSAIWIASSSVYPMAFDEDFHLGLIRIYSQHLSPFISSQPGGTYQFGAFTRDPSYLYHYLMSFPWRLITAVTDNFTAQVIAMRFIDIGFFGAGIVLFRKLLLNAKIPSHFVHLALLLFVLTPLTPLLAAQINYDNLFLPLLALSLIYTLKFSQQLKQHVFSWQQAILLASLCIFASLTKYAFLPIFAAIFVYCAWRLVQWLRKDRHGFTKQLVADLKAIKPLQKVLLLSLLLLSFGLFFERYGINTIRYHTPIPECNQVLSIEKCQAYGPWKRNYDIARTPQPPVSHSPLVFSRFWMKQMIFNLSFSLNGAASGYTIGNPLPLPSLAILLLCTTGLLVIILSLRHIWKNETLRLSLLLAGAYVGALWLQNFSDYLHLNLPVAIQGRYLLPVLIICYLCAIVGAARLLRNWHYLRLTSAGLAVAFLALGGGAFTYILRSDSSWYWPNKHVISVNQGIRDILKPVIPGSRSPAIGHDPKI